MIQKLGKYTIVEKLGEGAMGAVYKAYDEILDRYVAVKTMAEDIKWDPELKLRFYREARSAAGLHHPNIVTIHDLGEEGKITYIVMELLQGEDLKSLIARQAPISLEKKLSIIAQVADGLNHAHLNGIIHRDVKPGNIHVSPSGNVKIVDFGIARIPSSDLTRSGARLGTPIYMSPEQIRGSAYDERSDIFSTGIVFYELLTYRHPFRDKNIAKTLDNILFQSRFPFAEQFPDAPPGLWEIVETCLAKEPDQRYASMAELAKACRDLLVRLNVESQQMLKQLEASMQSLRRAATEGRASPMLAQALKQAESLMAREDRSDYCELKRITTVLADLAPATEAAAAPPGVRPAAATAAAPQEAAPSPDEARGRELMQSGRSLLDQGRPQEALEQLRRAMSLLGPKEEVVQALVAARKQLEERQRARSPQLEAAAQALAAREFERALEAVDQILAAEPANPEALELRRRIQGEIQAEEDRRRRREEGEKQKAAGLRLAAEQRFREARPLLERALELLGEDPEAKLALDRAAQAVRAEELNQRIRTELARAGELLQSGQPDKARAHVRFVLNLAPGHEEASQMLARIEQAEAELRKTAEIASRLKGAREALQRNDLESAGARAGEALALDPENAEAHALLEQIERAREEKRRRDEIDALLARGREALRRQSFDEAAARADEILQLDPGHAEALQLRQLIEQAREARKKLDEIDALLARGREALSRENLTEAKSLGEQALGIDPGLAQTREFLARVSSAQADKHKREELAALLARGQQAFLRDDFAEAEQCARDMLLLEAQHPRAAELLARIQGARAARRQENIDRCRADVTEALQKGDFERARARARELQELEPEGPQAAQMLDEIARAEERARQEEIARLLEESRRALQVEDFELAAQRAQQALDLDPRNKAARAELKKIEKERARKEKLRAREARRMEKEGMRPQPPGPAEGMALLDSSDKTIILDRPKPAGLPRWLLWAALGVAALAVIGIVAYRMTRPAAPREDVAALIETAQAALSRKDYSQAVEIADRILAGRPDNAEARALREEALRLRRQDDIDALLLEAQSMKAAAQYEDALNTVGRILQVDPSNAAALAVRDEIELLMKSAAPPSDESRQVAEWAAGARKLIAAGKLVEARAEIDKIARAAPAAPEVAQLRRLLAAREQAAKSSEPGQKEREAFDAAQRQNRLAELRRHAEEQFRSGKYGEALTYIDQWLGLAPEDAAAAALRGHAVQALQSRRAAELHLEQKHYDEALRALAQVEKINPADPAVAELRRRAVAQKAAARAFLSIFRLGAPAALFLDNEPIGREGEVSNLAVPVGTHKITLRTAQGKQFEKETEFYEGQTLTFVYDAAGPSLREMAEGDRAALDNRRMREEVHAFQVEHRHRFGHCTGTLLISGLKVEYSGSEKSHSFSLPFESLKLTVREDRVEIDTKDNKRNWDFKMKNANEAAQVKALWEKLLQTAR